MSDANNENRDENPMKTNKKSKKPKLSRIRITLIIFFIGTALFSAYSLYSISQEYKVGTEEYKDLRKYVKSIPQGVEKSSNHADIDFNSLKAINSEVVAWIHFENIDIDYPIVKGNDNSFYLTHTFNKKVNKAGSIFMDYLNDSKFKDAHTVIYGHNLKNSSMFSNLMKYKDKEFYTSNPYFWIFTSDSTYKCEIFSVYITTSSSEGYTLKFASKENHEGFLKSLKKNSLYDTGVSVTSEDSIISLSTCTNTSKESRILVHAKLLKQ